MSSSPPPMWVEEFLNLQSFLDWYVIVSNGPSFRSTMWFGSNALIAFVCLVMFGKPGAPIASAMSYPNRAGWSLVWATNSSMIWRIAKKKCEPDCYFKKKRGRELLIASKSRCTHSLTSVSVNAFHHGGRTLTPSR